MKKHLKILKRCLLVITPILASTIVGTAPSKAATFAFSEGNLVFTGFSQNPSNVATDTDTNTLIIGEGGMVQATAEAEAIFLIEPSVAFNSSLSTVFGENRNYLGLAESEASVIGNFNIDANTTFSFDFFSNLELATSIDNPSIENARASGDISFALIDLKNDDILEFFSLVGNITTEGDDDFVALQQSDNVILSGISGAPGFGGLQEFLTVSIEGSLERFFTDETDVALVEVKRNRAQVQAVPESSTSLALILSGGVIGVVLKRRRRN
ncbi:PEP-CTERM sorting domain-containing protein [Plectonema cf. radiosum LEGE 06105]|uniref:PEP-CTERM sorting domain-containing protein n=1 Tax=Plectonema cf. radiosum LEGE 06105 TaxID=945769 RepID=A0A8J7K189_9CYAN|nr:PEP-CTERM sorting domain-containing protein [Plectonema radiosum]MBE9213172.1 PEP-CTERM sorting domain-containing protein [Plectonema cf. radiosum LEGE 06105]